MYNAVAMACYIFNHPNRKWKKWREDRRKLCHDNGICSFSHRHDKRHVTITSHRKAMISNQLAFWIKYVYSLMSKKRMNAKIRMKIPKVIRIHVTLWCRAQTICVRNVDATFHRERSIAKSVNNALPNEIITAFGWIAVLANRTINSFWPAARWPCSHFYSVQIYRWLQSVIRFLCFAFSVSAFYCQTIAVMYLVSMSK